ncbi:MAG: biotin/lipoyl-binding protein [Planctomycetes bacterium]|nr:biotin/lipoyl-binding protein [Planctomycetota bacterium]
MIPQRYAVTCGDQRLVVEVSEQDGALTLTAGGRTHVLRLDASRRSLRGATLDDGRLRFGWKYANGTYEIVLDGQTYEISVADPRFESLLAVRPSETAGEGRTQVRAPIPGLVVAVRVRAGDKVEKNQSVVVLAAMKLENEIPAPRAGVVAEVLAKEGAAVEKGDVLLVIETPA